jgi:hypothetical protein
MYIYIRQLTIYWENDLGVKIRNFYNRTLHCKTEKTKKIIGPMPMTELRKQSRENCHVLGFLVGSSVAGLPQVEHVIRKFDEYMNEGGFYHRGEEAFIAVEMNLVSDKSEVYKTSDFPMGAPHG